MSTLGFGSGAALPFAAPLSAAVPEPSTFALLSMALFAVAGFHGFSPR